MIEDRLTLADVAERLGVSRRRVQAMVQTGQLDAQRVGRQWLVPVASVRRRERSVVSHPGRPLSADRVWELLQNQAVHLTDDPNPDALRRRLIQRAQHRNMWVHPGLLDEVRHRSDVVIGGRDAADSAGIPVGGDPQVDVYVAKSEADKLITSVVARPEPVSPNFFLHIVEDHLNDNIRDRNGMVPLIVAWLDLADRDDRAATLVFEHLARRSS